VRFSAIAALGTFAPFVACGVGDSDGVAEIVE
jgi:hypothetical protein